MAHKKKAKEPKTENYRHEDAKWKNMPLSYIFIFDVRDSAPMASSMSASWVEYIHDQCLTARVAFFFKQWGGFNKKKGGGC